MDPRAQERRAARWLPGVQLTAVAALVARVLVPTSYTWLYVEVVLWPSLFALLLAASVVLRLRGTSPRNLISSVGLVLVVGALAAMAYLVHLWFVFPDDM